MRDGDAWSDAFFRSKAARYVLVFACIVGVHAYALDGTEASTVRALGLGGIAFFLASEVVVLNALLIALTLAAGAIHGGVATIVQSVPVAMAACSAVGLIRPRR